MEYSYTVIKTTERGTSIGMLSEKALRAEHADEGGVSRGRGGHPMESTSQEAIRSLELSKGKGSSSLEVLVKRP